VQRAVHRARELLLEQAVHSAHLLLLAQLHAEVGEARPALAVLSGRIAAALDAALGGEAAVALQEQLGAFPTAEPTHRVVVTCHGCPLDAPALLRPTTVVGIGVTSLISVTLIPAA
jgi:hypothetical protein